MGTVTGAGTKLAISAATPATQDAVGYAALTWTTISDIENLGGFGASTEQITFTPLDGPIQYHKGPTNYGTLSPAIAHNDDDAGQTLLRTAAEDATDLFSFRVTLPDGAIRYFQGRVFGYPETVSGANAIVMANPSIGISTAIVKVAAP